MTLPSRFLFVFQSLWTVLWYAIYNKIFSQARPRSTASSASCFLKETFLLFSLIDHNPKFSVLNPKRFSFTCLLKQFDSQLFERFVFPFAYAFPAFLPLFQWKSFIVTPVIFFLSSFVWKFDCKQRFSLSQTLSVGFLDSWSRFCHHNILNQCDSSSCFRIFIALLFFLFFLFTFFVRRFVYTFHQFYVTLFNSTVFPQWF